MTAKDIQRESIRIKPKARQSIHGTILDWFSDKERGRVLDAPAGFGHLALRLKEMGFDVTCGEIEPGIFQAPGLECVYTDLSSRIKAGNGSFDYICCVEGLEHLINPYRALQEFSRILKPGGWGIFSIPNYSNIEKRFKYLWHGHLTKPVDREKFEKEGNTLFNFHNTPLTITILDFMFSINNLEVLEILRDKLKRKQYFFAPFVFLMKLAAAVSSERSKRKHRYDLTLKNEVILGGNNLIFITRKKIG